MKPEHTQGATRALLLANRLAEQVHAPQTTPMHLFWSLLLFESHAWDILQQCDVKLEQLPPQLNCPLETSELPQPTVLPEGSPCVRELWDLHDGDVQLQSVIHAAIQFANHQKNNAELGTEALLYGLASVTSDVKSYLDECDISKERLKRLQEADTLSEKIGEPIPVSFELQTASTNDRKENSKHHVSASRLLNTTESQTHSLYRILDAALNRAREGLRVVEDYCRMALNNSYLTEQWKRVRHGLKTASLTLSETGLLQARNTESDVGTAIQTSEEQARTNLFDVMVSNCKRLQEALRTLEEFGKILAPGFSSEIEQLRYRVYTLEKETRLMQSNDCRFSQSIDPLSTSCDLAQRATLSSLNQKPLYLLLTESSCRNDWYSTVERALAGGVSVVQLREKELSDREIVERGRQIAKLTKESAAIFIMNDRPDLALLANADGVHVGQEELSVHQVRQIIGEKLLIGVSTHHIDQARQAVSDGADYIGVGPTFPSNTKAFSETMGLEFVKRVASEISIPWYAIGGIGIENLSAVLEAGASRIALTAEICGADDPKLVAQTLMEQLTGQNF